MINDLRPSSIEGGGVSHESCNTGLRGEALHDLCNRLQWVDTRYTLAAPHNNVMHGFLDEVWVEVNAEPAVRRDGSSEVPGKGVIPAGPGVWYGYLRTQHLRCP